MMLPTCSNMIKRDSSISTVYDVAVPTRQWPASEELGGGGGWLPSSHGRSSWAADRRGWTVASPTRTVCLTLGSKLCAAVLGWRWPAPGSLWLPFAICRLACHAGRPSDEVPAAASQASRPVKLLKPRVKHGHVSTTPNLQSYIQQVRRTVEGTSQLIQAPSSCSCTTTYTYGSRVTYAVLYSAALPARSFSSGYGWIYSN